MEKNIKLVLTYCEGSLAIAETQYYLKSRGMRDVTIPKIFQAIQDEDYMIITSLIIFSIKSLSPTIKMDTIYGDLKFSERGLITNQLITLINKAMPESDEEDKKKEGVAQTSHLQDED